jgi:hypothetical protein
MIGSVFSMSESELTTRTADVETLTCARGPAMVKDGCCRIHSAWTQLANARTAKVLKSIFVNFEVMCTSKVQGGRQKYATLYPGIHILEGFLPLHTHTHTPLTRNRLGMF